MTKNKQYKIDLWLFIGSITVMLYILVVNLLLLQNSESITVLRDLLEWITVPIFIMGTCIPIVVVFRSIVKKTESKSLAILAILFSLLTAILIRYSTLVE